MKFSVRLARKEDKEPLMRFVSKTWPWGDYVPRVWDEWLLDSNGRLFVATCNGEPVGMNHVRFLGEGMAWLEGVRVKPEMRGMGVATLLGRHAMNYARRVGMKWTGLLSAEDNYTAHRQIERMRMKKVCSFGLYEWEKEKTERSMRVPVRIAGPNELTIFRSGVTHSPEYAATKGNFALDWTVKSFAKYGYGRLLREGRVFLPEVKNNEMYENFSAVVSSREGGRENSLMVSFICGKPSITSGMLTELTRSWKGDGRVYAMVCETKDAVSALQDAGFKRENGFLFFRRRISEQRDF